MPTLLTPTTLLRSLTMILVLMALAACGGAAIETEVADGERETSPFAPSGEHWLTGTNVGGEVGDTAHATPVLLAGNDSATLEELAGGKPLLLYFYATW